MAEDLTYRMPILTLRQGVIGALPAPGFGELNPPLFQELHHSLVDIF
ncbi:MAG: hypothetical protein AAF662_03510 [Pseudomonadota bacterium]